MKKYSFNAELFSQKLSEWIGDRPLREVAKETGMHMIDLSRYRNCKRQPTTEKLVALCFYMDKDVNAFFSIDRKPE